MANASSDGTPADRREQGSSLVSTLALRAAAFVVGSFLLGIAITAFVGDDGFLGVLVGILYSLGAITVLIGLVLGVLAAVRRARGRQ
jgi:hypothetical protein